MENWDISELRIECERIAGELAAAIDCDHCEGLDDKAMRKRYREAVDKARSELKGLS